MTDETVEKILTSLRSIDRAVVAARDALLERPQDAHTPRTAPQTRSGGTESGEGVLDTTPEQAYGRKHLQREEVVRIGLSGTCARCGAPITLPMDDPNNYEMAVCTPCEIEMLREAYQQARGQVDAVRSLAKQMRHEAASVQPMTERGVGLWDAAAALDKIVGGPGQNVRHG